MASPRLHHGQSLSVASVREGDMVPVGGKNMLNNKLDLHVNADFSKMEAFFDDASKMRRGIDHEKLGQWLESAGIDAAPKTFAAMWAFQNAVEKHYPHISKNARQQRMDSYRDATPDLSDIVTNGRAQCAEISLMAHHFLNREDIQSTFFVGAVAWSHDAEFPGSHAYLVLRKQDGGGMVFDPANPVKTSAGKMPGFCNITAPQLAAWDDAKDHRNSYMALTCAISKKDYAYGVSTGANIYPERDFVRPDGTTALPAVKPPAVRTAPPIR